MWRVAALIALAMVLGCVSARSPEDDETLDASPPSYRSYASYAPEDEPARIPIWGDGVLRAQVDTADGVIDVPSFLVRWKTDADLALITAHRLPPQVGGVRARTVSGVEVVRSGTLLSLPQARAATPDDASADLTVWRVPDAAGARDYYRYQLGFASKPPLRGERVILSVNVPGSARVRHNAVVVEVTPQVLRYEVHGSVDLRGAAGAPVLNLDGLVVGMHVAATERDGAIHGDANPASAMGAELQRAW
jgi:hypothetical protein